MKSDGINKLYMVKFSKDEMRAFSEKACRTAKIQKVPCGMKSGKVKAKPAESTTMTEPVKTKPKPKPQKVKADGKNTFAAEVAARENTKQMALADFLFANLGKEIRRIDIITAVYGNPDSVNAFTMCLNGLMKAMVKYKSTFTLTRRTNEEKVVTLVLAKKS